MTAMLLAGNEINFAIAAGLIMLYSMLVAILPCYNQYQVPLGTWYSIIAQVYRLSAVHCQMTRYSQGVPGYLTRYSCVSQ